MKTVIFFLIIGYWSPLPPYNFENIEFKQLVNFSTKYEYVYFDQLIEYNDSLTINEVYYNRKNCNKGEDKLWSFMEKGGKFWYKTPISVETFPLEDLAHRGFDLEISCVRRIHDAILIKPEIKEAPVPPEKPKQEMQDRGDTL